MTEIPGSGAGRPRVPAAPAGAAVHWIGTGLSTGSGLALLAGSAARVVVWGRTEDKARACAERLGVAGRVETGAYSPQALADALAPGDVAVSMLPAGGHGAVIAAALGRGAHFACSSYLSAELESAAAGAAGRGLAVVTDAGLDPGIDHLYAHVLVDRARRALGDGPAVARFTSYCGGVPAEPNEFRYRFSWAPRGVLTALASPARFVDDGRERTVARPWEAVRTWRIGAEDFEAYPNRDSLGFAARYGFPRDWELDGFVRGTLRLQGWSTAWKDVFAVVAGGEPERIAALADELAARYPTGPGDLDRVVLAVGLEVRARDGRAWAGSLLLDTVGDGAESAMARCVSVPLGLGVLDILAGRAPLGLSHGFTDPAHAAERIEQLRAHGVETASSMQAAQAGAR